MSFLKLVKLAKKFEAKLEKAGQPVRYVTGPGQYMTIDPSKVQLPPEKTEHEKLLEQVPPPPPEQPAPQPVFEQTKVKKVQPKPNPNVKKVQDFLNQQVAEGKLAAAPINFPNGYWTKETAEALKNWARQSRATGNMNTWFSAVLALSNLPAASADAQRAGQDAIDSIHSGPELSKM